MREGVSASVGVVVAVLAIGAAPAQAGSFTDTGSTYVASDNGLSYYKTDSQKITAGSRGAEAECPMAGGKLTTGGGGAVPGTGQFQGLKATAPGVSGLFDPARSWVATFTNTNSPTSLYVRAYAICASVDRRKVVEKSRTTSSAGPVSAKAPCPSGTSVSGGGVLTTSIDFLESSMPYDGADADHRPDDGWRGTVEAGGATGIAVRAVCIRGVPLTYHRERTAHPTSSASASLLANCGGGGAVTGGGGSIGTPSASSVIRGTLPVISGNTAPGWLFYANIASGAHKLTAVAICKS
jgi:hypothetical protein